jgi:hypothetical protein
MVISLLFLFRKFSNARHSFILLIVFFAVTAIAQPVRQCGVASTSRKTISFPQARSADDKAVFYIPVVFHIVYNQFGQNIPDEQIYSQLKVINEDFSRTNADSAQTLNEFKAVAASCGIQFYLAQKDGVKGITRTSTTHGPFFNDDLHVTARGGKDAWDTGKYLNVWVAPLASGLFGYGSPPDTPEFRDGVAVHFEYFGRHENALAPYNLGRTLSHEIGHWLGLQHPWGTGGCNTDDGLSDTPAQEGPTYGCVLNQFSCGSLNMVQNFMNTSTDNCMNLFTLQQRNAMRNILINLRPDVFGTEEIVTGIDTEIRKPFSTVYPNPVTQQPFTNIILTGNSFSPMEISIHDLYGRAIHHYVIAEYRREVAIDLQGLSNGVYIARIYNDQSVYITKIYLNIN